MNCKADTRKEKQKISPSEVLEITISTKEEPPPKYEAKYLRKRIPKAIIPDQDTLINCHHCHRIRTINEVLICKNDSCRESYCFQCVKKIYMRAYHKGKSINSLEKMSERREWECYKCGKRCLCLKCHNFEEEVSNNEEKNNEKTKKKLGDYSHLESKINKVEINEKGIIKIIMKKKKKKPTPKRNKSRYTPKSKSAYYKKTKNNKTITNKKQNYNQIYNSTNEKNLETNTIIINNASIIEIKKPREEIKTEDPKLELTGISSDNKNSTTQNDKIKGNETDSYISMNGGVQNKSTSLNINSDEPRQSASNGYSLFDLKDDALIQSLSGGKNPQTEAQLKGIQNKNEMRLHNKLYKIASLCEHYYKNKCKSKYLAKDCISCKGKLFHVNELLRFKNVDDFLNYLRYLFKYMKNVIDYKKKAYNTNKEELFDYYKKYSSNTNVHSSWSFKLPKIICKFCVIRAVNQEHCLKIFKALLMEREESTGKPVSTNLINAGTTPKTSHPPLNRKMHPLKQKDSGKKTKSELIKIEKTSNAITTSIKPNKEINDKEEENNLNKQQQVVTSLSSQQNVFDQVFNNRTQNLFNDKVQATPPQTNSNEKLEENSIYINELEKYNSSILELMNNIISYVFPMKNYYFNRDEIFKVNKDIINNYMNEVKNKLSGFQELTDNNNEVMKLIFQGCENEDKENSELVNELHSAVDENYDNSRNFINEVNQFMKVVSNHIEDPNTI